MVIMLSTQASSKAATLSGRILWLGADVKMISWLELLLVQQEPERGREREREREVQKGKGRKQTNKEISAHSSVHDTHDGAH